MRSAFATFGIEVKPALKAVEKAVSQLGGVYTGRDDPLIQKDKAIMFPAVRSVFDFVSKKFSGNWLANVRNAATLADGFIKAGRGQEEDVEIIKGSGSKSITFNRATFEALKKRTCHFCEKQSDHLAYWSGGWQSKDHSRCRWSGSV